MNLFASYRASNPSSYSRNQEGVTRRLGFNMEISCFYTYTERVSNVHPRAQTIKNTGFVHIRFQSARSENAAGAYFLLTILRKIDTIVVVLMYQQILLPCLFFGVSSLFTQSL